MSRKIPGVLDPNPLGQPSNRPRPIPFVFRPDGPKRSTLVGGLLPRIEGSSRRGAVARSADNCILSTALCSARRTPNRQLTPCQIRCLSVRSHCLSRDRTSTARASSSRTAQPQALTTRARTARRDTGIRTSRRIRMGGMKGRIGQLEVTAPAWSFRMRPADLLERCTTPPAEGLALDLSDGYVRGYWPSRASLCRG